MYISVCLSRWRIPVNPTMKASLLYTMLSVLDIQRLSSFWFSLASMSTLLTVMAGKFKLTAEMVHVGFLDQSLEPGFYMFDWFHENPSSHHIQSLAVGVVLHTSHHPLPFPLFLPSLPFPFPLVTQDASSLCCILQQCASVQVPGGVWCGSVCYDLQRHADCCW